ncbi:MAG: histone deacetylase [Myxococcota bacterium]|nr:histone deacetylase [Myxococcota bacterium]
MSVHIYGHLDMREHKPGSGHPECPKRLDAIESKLREDHRYIFKVGQPASREQIERVHPSKYIEHLARFRDVGGILDADTVLSEKSMNAAWLAAGCSVDATRAVCTSEAQSAMALTRPPGHHAEPNKAMGFCLFSNVAIAAEAALAEFGCQRVMIIDWDVHHGNGTQKAFWDRQDVYFVSLHQAPLYPGTGHPWERGAGSGLGYTLNIPLPAGSGDGLYHDIFLRDLMEAANLYRPDLIIVSAGFDAHRLDPLAQMNLSSNGFAALCDLTYQMAKKHCDGRLVLCLEGGYHLGALAESMGRCGQILLGGAPDPISRPIKDARLIHDYVQKQLRETKWPI